MVKKCVLCFASFSCIVFIFISILKWNVNVPCYNRGYSRITENVVHSKEEMDDLLAGSRTEQDDPKLLSVIRHRFLDPPSMGPYRLKRPSRIDYSQHNQSVFLDHFLRKKNGFFVECGASDGEYLSNTLFFEKSRNWTGLLIEANPISYKGLLTKKRRAFSINACLSTLQRSQRIKFKLDGVFGGISSEFRNAMKNARIKHTHDIDVQCFTLYSIMLALGRTHIDYLSLDVEGPELSILATIPFKKLTIDVFSIEFKVPAIYRDHRMASIKKLNMIREFFRNIGTYKEIAILPLGKPLTESVDVVFARQDLIKIKSDSQSDPQL